VTSLKYIFQDSVDFKSFDIVLLGRLIHRNGKRKRTNKSR